MSRAAGSAVDSGKEELFVRHPGWRDYPWLAQASSTRAFLRPGETAIEQTRRLLDLLGAPKDVAVIDGQQRHTNRINAVTAEDVRAARAEGYRRFPETDGLVTTEPGAALAIFTADCVPVCIADPVRRAIANVHAGWRGSLANIAGRAVAALCAAGSRAADLEVWLGPSICGRSYEVSEELVEQFAEACASAAQDGYAISDGRLLNLQAVNSWQLLRSGVRPERITDSGICTLEQSGRFPSYRVEQQQAGRIVTVMALLPR